MSSSPPNHLFGAVEPPPFTVNSNPSSSGFGFSTAAPKYKSRGKAKLLDVTRKVATEGRDALEPFHDTGKQEDANSKKLIQERMTTRRTTSIATSKDLGGANNEEYVRAHPPSRLPRPLETNNIGVVAATVSCPTSIRNMYANQMTMQHVISELLPNLIFVPIIPPDNLVPLGRWTNPRPLQADNDVAGDDDEAANLGD
ncbi:hypothetical protein TIFTF001_032164 [Ficus carica]|uniref:Uncharacterized protein n=1 Tax=Ficus carica TaxID=3494 RepID=A0AA88J5D6_FICCA|nr:hypothetical protein TIFTF001_032164 [Ficus carica]